MCVYVLVLSPDIISGMLEYVHIHTCIRIRHHIICMYVYCTYNASQNACNFSFGTDVIFSTEHRFRSSMNSGMFSTEHRFQSSMNSGMFFPH